MAFKQDRSPMANMSPMMGGRVDPNSRSYKKMQLANTRISTMLPPLSNTKQKALKVVPKMQSLNLFLKTPNQ